MTSSPAQLRTFAALGSQERVAERARKSWISAPRWLLVSTLLAAPLAYGAVEPWAWATLYLLAFLTLVLWCLEAVRQQRLRIVWSPLYIPALLFLALGLSQYFGHHTLDAFGTRDALIALVTDLVLFFLAVQVFSGCSPRVWKQFGLLVTLYAFFMGLFAIVQVFSGNGRIYWVVESAGRIFGPYVNHNDYAGLMEMLVPVSAMYVLSRSEDDRGRVLLLISLSVPIASLLLSGSRGGLISFVGEVLIFAGLLWRRFPSQSFRRVLAAGSLGLSAAALLFLWMAPENVSGRLASVANVVNAPEATYGDRMHVSYDALRIFGDHPFLGTGLGSFGSVFPAYQSFPTDQLYPYAHNDYAQALAETGVAGAIIVIASLILFFALAFGNLRVRLERDSGWIRLGAALGVCGLLIHSFVDFNLHIPANAAWFGVLVALSTTGASGQGRPLMGERQASLPLGGKD